MKSENNVALKEWAVVNRALEEGRQVFLLRKGGVVEKDGAFNLDEKEFFIYPTYAHQEKSSLGPKFASWIEDAAATRPPEGQVDFNVYAQVDEVIRVSDREALKRALTHTIWSEDLLRRRGEHDASEPFHLVFIRCFRTPHPHRLPVDPEYAGCTSWVKLKQPLPTRFYPVNSKEVFEEKKALVVGLLRGGGNAPS